MKRSIRERALVLRAIPPVKDLCLRSEPIMTSAIDNRGRHVRSPVSVSAVRIGDDRDVIEALKVDGDWGHRARLGDRVSVTAQFCGDPEPHRSALHTQHGVPSAADIEAFERDALRAERELRARAAVRRRG